MISLLSPAKSLDYSTSEASQRTLPRALDDSHQLIRSLRNMSQKKIGELMSISKDLSKLNQSRYKDYSKEFTKDNSKQAILAFKGDVYLGLDNDTLSEDDLAWAQGRFRILSGLYGVLRPLDAIQPYRLEMGTRMKTRRGKSLYDFWGDKITDQLNEDLSTHNARVVLNLASKEYFQSVRPSKLDADLYSADFLEKRDGEYKLISFTAKRARGWMSRFIIDNRIDDPEDIRSFDREGFKYVKKLSSPREFVFVRPGPTS